MRKNLKWVQKIVAVCIAVCTIFSQSVWQAKAAESISTAKVTGKIDYDSVYEVHKLLNEEREKRDLPPLALDGKLTEAAMQRAAEIGIYYSHQRPNGSGFETAYVWSVRAGENISLGPVSPKKVMEKWMNEDGHRDNLLAGSKSAETYTKIGIGCFYHNGKRQWVQVFSGGTAAAPDENQKGEATKTFDVAVAANRLNLFSDEASSTIELEAKASKTVSIYNKNLGLAERDSDMYKKTIISPNSNFEFTCSPAGIVKYENGKIFAQSKAGKATVNVYLRGNASKAVSFSVNVKVKPTSTPKATTTNTVKTTAKPTTKATVKPASSINFKDVKSSHWFYKAVMYTAENGLMKGTSSTLFSPNATLTRSQFVTILGRMEGVDTKKYTGNAQFTDVNKKAYYAPYVVWAKKNNIINGTSSTKFSPEAPLTREQMAAIMCRYLDLKKVNLSKVSNSAAPFKDTKEISGFAKSSVEKMRLTGVLNGDGKGYFVPKRSLSRAEGATVIFNLHPKLKNLKVVK